MAKTKTPLLSLGAHGTLASQLTLQKTGALTMVRQKPTPSDPQTLLQMYQRWEVQDYVAYWQTLSDAQKLVYFRAGARNHRTPVAEFLKEMLTDLPDIAARYHLDTKSVNTVLDSSKNTNNGTVTGALITPATIDNGLSFDGIDDHVDIPHHSSLVLTDQFTMMMFIKHEVHAIVYPALLNKASGGLGWVYAHQLQIPATVRQRIYVAGAFNLYSTNHSIIPGTTQHVAVSYNGTNLIFYVDGQVDKAYVTSGAIVDDGNPLIIGGTQLGFSRPKCVMDNIVILNRALTQEEIYLHSQRRYPL